ncbi:carbonate dehydratase [Novipirellula artificiosorum]|uniref:Carbonic anhydrase n=1 Tax=Novipirellula artificiosorum TaxID=2528016 RepID=A0A5C6DRA1_9BACT|nr:carbonate dehydratase [Novipirellula artificiosorum]TWU38397.1 Carbonic anhydrase 2 [Novipirellula artificiosorum]
MRLLKDLFDKNRAWAARSVEADPQFFERLSHLQSPKYLWIGCADSRVPANQIVGLDPGELFVHRNIANLVVHTDLNCLSVMQFAVEVLNVEHIIVCGHYGCGGVSAALFNKELGLSENWIRHLQDVVRIHQSRLDEIEVPRARCDLLCELNVVEQVMNVCRTTIVREAWRCGQSLAVHGWIYSLDDGRLRDLNTSITSSNEMVPFYENTLDRLGRK